MIANDNVMGIDISIVWAYIYIYQYNVGKTMP